jgi:putative glucoamylase/PA14 domain-containing protein
MVQGMFAARQYFDSADPVEAEIRSRATQLCEGVEWDWYRRAGETDGTHLYWLWSPTHGWDNSFPFGGAEVMITYLMAIASPTHPIPASCYYDGFGGGGGYENGDRYYGFTQWVSAYETMMFWTHYSYLGFDPREKRDNYCNYFDNSRNTSLIDREYCIENPGGFTGYSDLVWGLTASYSPWGYIGHAPGGADNGTITPTAAISSIPYTPAESLASLKHFYHTYGNDLWGPFGFYDAFNLGENWYSDGYLAIDQGTIVPMIENSRTGFCWDLFMSSPEIQPMLDSIGWATGSGAGLKVKYYEGSWSSIPDFGTLTPVFEEVASIPKENIGNRDDYYGLRFRGFISIDQPGTYTFYTNSDDGSNLYIDGVLVVDNDGLHGEQERSGTISLTAGKHLIKVDFIEADGNALLEVSYAGPGITKQKMPVNVLFRCNLDGDINNDCCVDITDLRIMAADWLNDYTFVDFAEMAGSWLE